MQYRTLADYRATGPEVVSQPQGSVWWRNPRSGGFSNNDISPVPLADGRPPKSTFRLNGEEMRSTAQAKLAYRKGAFMYQVRGINDDRIRYCRNDSDLEQLARRLDNGRRVVFLQLVPDLPPAAPPPSVRPVYYGEDRMSSWW
ncbi:hypothetical protein K8R03_01010 [Candidatus Kaiserbacteria bacterium]|nr:hypothetical protein [Candidatus Kaiserbacteria bacterium]